MDFAIPVIRIPIGFQLKISNSWRSWHRAASHRYLDIQAYTVDDVKGEQSSSIDIALANISKAIDKEYVQQLAELVHTCSDVFPDELPGTIPQHVVEHVIEFKPDARVIKLPPYNLAPKHLVFVKQTIDMLLNKGFIQRSVSPYAVPIR